MSRPHSRRRALLGLSVAALCLSSLATHAWAEGYQKGPAPTAAALEQMGPYALGTASLPASSDYNNKTVIYYPNAAGAERFGLVVLCPGFVSTGPLYAGVAQRIASHGFVVAQMNTKSLFDQPIARGQQIEAVMKAVLAQNPDRVDDVVQRRARDRWVDRELQGARTQLARAELGGVDRFSFLEFRHGLIPLML